MSDTLTLSAAVKGLPQTATTAEGDMYFETDQKKHASYSNGLAGWFDRCIFSQYADVTHAGIVTAQSVITAGNAIGTVTLPANFWKRGKALRYRLNGVYTTDAAAGNATVSMLLASGTFRTTGSFALDANSTSGFWEIEGAMVCQTTGATGTLQGPMTWEHSETSGGGTPLHAQLSNTATPFVLSTTAAAMFDVQWTATDAGTTLVCSTVRLWEIA